MRIHWISVSVAPRPRQILLASSQEIVLPTAEQTSNLGPILSPKVRSVKAMFRTPSFLDPNPNVNMHLGCIYNRIQDRRISKTEQILSIDNDVLEEF